MALRGQCLIAACFSAALAVTTDAQTAGRVYANIFRLYADSAGRVFAAGSSRPIVSVRDRLEDFASQPGATVWFSWAGAPAPRTVEQQRALARVERTNVRVEFRSDSTLRGQLLRNRDEHTSVVRLHDTAVFIRTNARRRRVDTTMYVLHGDTVTRVIPGPPRDLPPSIARGMRRFFMK
jgi:hypothetical protein